MQDAFGTEVPRRRRGRPSRLSRATGEQPQGKSGVDRFHYLFEAIEADKASDSETANEGTSSSPRAGNQDDAQDTSSAPPQILPGGPGKHPCRPPSCGLAILVDATK